MPDEAAAAAYDYSAPAVVVSTICLFFTSIFINLILQNSI